MSRLIALVAVFLCVAASAQTFEADYARAHILRDNDPFAAANFLRDTNTQAALKAANEPLYQEVVGRAAELKDLQNLLHGLAEARAIRLALEARPLCAFCQKPPELEAWGHRWFNYLDKSKWRALDEALLEWSTLTKERRDWLKTQSVDEAAWKATDLHARVEKLGGWAKARYDALMKQSPADAAAADAFATQVWAISDLIGQDQWFRLHERLDAVKQSVGALADAEKKLAAKNADPKLKALLAQAKATPDMDARLELLGGIFDGLGAPRAALKAAAPPSAAQTFDDTNRPVVAALLAQGLLAQTDGTQAGQVLRDFYQKQKLDLRLAKAANANWIGWHANGVMTFNEAHLTDFLQARGRTIRDLQTDHNLLDALAAELAPLFVHEATHARQEVWAREQKLPQLVGQHLELEAMQTEALFIIEKLKKDPAYKKRLEADAATSVPARESLSKAQRMLTGGPQYFRDTIEAWHYPETLSLEGVVWCQIEWHRTARADMEKELARRAKLTPEERKRLDKGPAFPTAPLDAKQFADALSSVNTASLAAQVAKASGRLEDLPEEYQAYEKRLADHNASVARQLALLKGEAVQQAMADHVPPPGSHK